MPITGLTIISNPYDYIGQMHNQGLDFVINVIHNAPCAVKEEVIVKLTSQFVSQFCFSKGTSPLLIESSVVNALNYRRLNVLPPIDNPTQAGFVNDLLTIADTYVNPFEHLGVITTQVNDLNQTVFLSSLTEEEKMSVLGASSVYLNSLYYWNQIVQTEDNKWATYSSNQSVSLIGLNWGKVGKEDLKGAIGGLAGALIGGGGALLGAVGGAVGASVAEVVIQIIEKEEEEEGGDE